MAKGNEKFIRRQKEVERQKAQDLKRQKRAERHAEKKKGAGEDDVAAIQAALDAGIDPNTLRNDEPADEEAAPVEESET